MPQQVKYLTSKSLFEDQLYQLLDILHKQDMIVSSSALDTIVNAYKKLEKNPNFRVTDLIYDPEQHKVVKAPIEPMNFALSHVAVMSKNNEIYFFSDNNKIIFVYDMTQKYQPMEVYLFLCSILEDPQYYNLKVTPLIDPDQEAIEEIIGVPLIN